MSALVSTDTNPPDGGNCEQFGSALPNCPALSAYPEAEAHGNRVARGASCTVVRRWGPEGTLLAPGRLAWPERQFGGLNRSSESASR